ncbi:hypothetical protein [Pseudomonas oryzae]|uniref:hypothetical protein n=1 Tax=Pseudomonas oryzae TaxID=1392877 RepID=UPI0012FE31F3|nr:hypothetical protein [Pseudomonas oryzae]
MPQAIYAKECWALTDLKGQIAPSTNGYAFQSDGFSNPMVLCFDEDKGSVSGDDTQLTRFGKSTLAGWGANKDIELFEVYQIDRVNGKVLFTKSRIGTSSLIPGAPDLVGAFVGKATRLKQ